MEIQTFLAQNRPILLDGAIGTLLTERGYDTPAPRWSAAVLEDHPEEIQRIHTEYLIAGAQLITTATFRTTSRVYGKIGKSKLVRDLNVRAVELARNAIDGGNAFIAGSVAPLEDCYRPDLVPSDSKLEHEHQEQIEWLTEAGVDCILFETMNTLKEAVTCSRIASELPVPYFVSFVCDIEGTLLSGESILEAFQAVREYQPLGMLINCTQPSLTTDLLRQMAAEVTLPIGAYANAGKSEPEQGGTINDIFTPGEYLEDVKEWLQFNPILVGGCCGTTPEHIRVIRQYLSSIPVSR